MLFSKLHRHNASSTLDGRRRIEPATFERGSATARTQARVAREFYADVLQGTQVWDSERAGTLAFIVAGTRIDVSTSTAADREPVVLAVGDPDALAERCWDAGYSVQVSNEATGDGTVSVIDPFGRRIDLVR